MNATVAADWDECAGAGMSAPATSTSAAMPSFSFIRELPSSGRVISRRHTGSTRIGETHESTCGFPVGADLPDADNGFPRLRSLEAMTADHNSPSRWRFRPPPNRDRCEPCRPIRFDRWTFRFRVEPVGEASSYLRSVLGAPVILSARAVSVIGADADLSLRLSRSGEPRTLGQDREALDPGEAKELSSEWAPGSRL